MTGLAGLGERVMGWLFMRWGRGEPPAIVPQDDYDRQMRLMEERLREMGNAVEVLQRRTDGHERGDGEAAE